MKFVISSNVNYVDATEDKIINSLVESGVNIDDIYLFVGGYDIDYGYRKLSNEIQKYSAPHNSLDFTGLISVVEMDIKSDYWFLLHDTCYVGPNFYNTVKNYNYNDINYVSLTYDVSMNIGAYRWEYLMDRKNEILSYKNNSNDLQYFKTRLINEEDFFIKPRHNNYCPEPRMTQGPFDYYNNNTQRIIEYFPIIDLYKVKANWTIKSNYELKL